MLNMISGINNTNPPIYLNSISFAGRRKVKNNSTVPALTSSQVQNDVFACAPKRTTEEEFIALRENFYKKVTPKLEEARLASWNYNTCLTQENAQILKEKRAEVDELYKDVKVYRTLKNIDIKQLSPRRAHQLKELIAAFELKNLEKSSKPNILSDRMIKKLYNGEYSKKPEKMLRDLRNLAHLRNKMAKTMGYKDFYDFSLKYVYNIKPKEFETQVDDFSQKALPQIKELIKNRKPMQQIKNNLFFPTKNELIYSVFGLYRNMGEDVLRHEQDGSLMLDMFPREKKNRVSRACQIKPNDVRVLANVRRGLDDYRVLSHELAHALYWLNIDKSIPNTEKNAHPALTEAIAMMMESLIKREHTLDKELGGELLDMYKQDKSEDAIRLATMLSTVNFEKELYKNPNQDLKKLWKECIDRHGLKGKGKNIPWTIAHIIQNPCYYQNYLRGQFMQAQIYKHLKNELGEISKNPNTMKYLTENIFKYGTSLSENEIIEKMTGKPLGVDDLVETLSS